MSCSEELFEDMRNTVQETASERDEEARRFISHQLARAREASGLNQTSLGRLIGKHPQTIDKWEAGETRVPAEFATAIAFLCGIAPTTMLMLGCVTPVTHPGADKPKNLFFENCPSGEEATASLLRFGGFAVAKIDYSGKCPLRLFARMGDDELLELLQSVVLDAEEFGSINRDAIEGLKQLTAKRLANARRDRGVSQSDMAEWLGVTRLTYSNYEKGKTSPSVQTTVEASLILEKDPLYILGLANVQNGPFAAGRADAPEIVKSGQIMLDDGCYDEAVAEWGVIVEGAWSGGIVKRYDDDRSVSPSDIRFAAVANPDDVTETILQAIPEGLISDDNAEKSLLSQGAF